MTEAYLWSVVLGCILATFVWRLSGAVFTRLFTASDEFFHWVTCVSYAMIGGLIVRLIFFPESALADIPMIGRAASLALAFLAFRLFRGSVLASMLAGTGSLIVMGL